jgi:hypothetical protein
MAKGDIYIIDSGVFGNAGSLKYQVQAGGTPPAINAGEPVAYAVGQQYATTLATSKPVVGTDTIAGISMTASTELASVTDGTVQVLRMLPGVVYGIAPKTAATWNTQALYNALVGARITLDKTTGIYTANASDSANNGCVVRDLNITQYPNTVAFSFRNTLDYLD